MSDDDRATPETPRQRGGLLGLLGRLFGRGKQTAPSEPLPVLSVPAQESAAEDAEPQLPGRPTAWEGPLARAEAAELPEPETTLEPDGAPTLPAPLVEGQPEPSSVAAGPSAAPHTDDARRAAQQSAWSQLVGARPADHHDAEPPAPGPGDAGMAQAHSDTPSLVSAPADPVTARLNSETEPLVSAPADAAPAPLHSAVPPPAPEAGQAERVTADSEIASGVHSASEDPAPSAVRIAAPPPSAGEQTVGESAIPVSRPLANPLERARAALEEARRQMPGLLADVAETQPLTVEQAAREKPLAAEWPGMLEGLRQAREGLAGEVAQLRAVVGELRREVGRLSDVVTDLQQPGGARPPASAAAGSAIPRLEAIMEQLRSISGRSAALGARPFAAGSGAPIVPPAILQNTPPFGSRPLPSIFFTGATPAERPFAAASTAPSAPEPSTGSATDPANGQGGAAAGRGAYSTLSVAPVEGLRALSALERRVAATSGVQRLELAGYRRGEATFRVTLAAGATIQDAIKSVPDAAMTIADVRVEQNAAHVRLSPRAEAALSSS